MRRFGGSLVRQINVEHLDEPGRNACPVCKGARCFTDRMMSEHTLTNAMTTPADVDPDVPRPTGHGTKRARSISRLEALKARIPESMRDAGDVQKPTSTSDRKDRRAGRTLYRMGAEESVLKNKMWLGYATIAWIDWSNISISELSDSFGNCQTSMIRICWDVTVLCLQTRHHWSRPRTLLLRTLNMRNKRRTAVGARRRDGIEVSPLYVWNCRTEPKQIFDFMQRPFMKRILHPCVCSWSTKQKMVRNDLEKPRLNRWKR
jgi:hypothetical protein